MSPWYSAEVLEVVRRAARRDERQPEDDDDREPRSSAARASPRHPPVAQNHAANGTRNGSTWGLVISATARSAAASPFRPVHGADDRGQRGQHVDRLVLAPPGADVEDGRVQDDRRGPDDRPARPVAERVRDQQRQPDVGDRRRGLHQRPDRRVRRVGRRSGTPAGSRPATPRRRPSPAGTRGSGRRRSGARRPRCRGPTGRTGRGRRGALRSAAGPRG